MQLQSDCKLNCIKVLNGSYQCKYEIEFSNNKATCDDGTGTFRAIRLTSHRMELGAELTISAC